MEYTPSIQVDLAPAEVDIVQRPDGSIILNSPQNLEDFPPSAAQWLVDWAKKVPDRLLFAERSDSQWRKVSYAEALASASGIGQALLNHGLGPKRPLMVLSGNSIDHGLLMLGAYLVGVPIVPVSVAYSLRSEDCNTLKYIYDLVEPGLVYVSDTKTFSRAISALDLEAPQILTSEEKERASTVDSFVKTAVTDAVHKAHQRVTPDTLAKILFTSGSTGQSKGVLNPHKMICANQQMIAQTWPFLSQTPPVLVDWLPWNHTFGGNHNFHMVLRNGGSLWIDEGKPVPELVGRTVSNLKEVSPSIYFNVPAGFRALLPYLEEDEELRHSFFRRLQVIFYAGAALPQDLWERLEAVSIKASGRRVLLTSAWGATETAPMATSAHFPLEKAGVIGLPAPGVQLKLAPVGKRLEMRVKGPNVTPGYFKRPDLSEAAFDEDGYYCTGDAGFLEDPENPSAGICFGGRITEDFKLSTGTWVQAGNLRVALLEACAPLLAFAVIAGHDQDFVAALAWAAPEAPQDMREQLVARLSEWNALAKSSSRKIRRLLLLNDAPNIDANEITDKGYINQRAVLDHRASQVKMLFQPVSSRQVIEIK